jgi:hypothetical protein
MSMRFLNNYCDTGFSLLIAFGHNWHLGCNTFLKLRPVLSQPSALHCYGAFLSDFYAPIHGSNDLFSWGGNGGAWSSMQPPDLHLVTAACVSGSQTTISTH